jgi:anti-sigma factor RsiW
MIRRLRARRRPLSCRAVGKLLQAYLDGEVPDTAALLVADHLDDCRRCGLEAETYRALVTALAQLSPPEDAERLERLRAFADELVSTP